MPDSDKNKDKCLGESDWDDIDLLTTSEATERLDDDIAELRSRLAEDPDDAALQTRLDLLIGARERLSTPRKFNFPKA